MDDGEMLRFVERAKGRRIFLASALADFAEIRGFDDAALAAFLGCPVETLTDLRLCRAPREDPDEFREDLEAVVARFPADIVRLAGAVRESRAAWRLQEQVRPGDAGHLLAARDADPPPEAPP